jgi:hypothetical protein
MRQSYWPCVLLCHDLAGFMLKETIDELHGATKGYAVRDE